MTLKEVNGPQPGKVAKSALSRIQSFQRLWDDEFSESAVAPSSQTSDRAIPWSPSPDRQSTSNGKISAKQFDASIRLQRELQNGVAALANSKANFEAKASKVSSSNKSNIIQNSNVAVSRPEKRKVEMVLSDDEAEPIPKRRPAPAPAPSSASNSVPTSSANKIQPWDMNHSTMKPPANQPVSGAATVNTKKPVAELVELSNQQKEILDVVMDGKNVFFTGSAGTGKSVLLRSIIKSMRRKYYKSSDAVAVTASTGIAACNIGGVTLHSFGGVGLGTESAPELAAKVRKNPKANTRWVRTKALIIDEISMLEGDFFDKLEHVARLVRKKPEPFGGIQLILTGDFFQLPPVTKGVVKFAFHAKTWKECVDHTFNLTRVFRQKDQGFVEMLNEMRFGRLSQKSIQAFMARSRPLPDDGIEPTELFPRREDVDRANKERLDRLEGESYTYNAQDGGLADERSRNTMLNNFMAPKSLLLKVNAQVMMIKNVDEQLVNGTVGKVIRFMTEREWTDSLFAGSRPADKEETTKEKEKTTGKKREEMRYPVVEWKIGHSRNSRVDLVRDETFKVEGPNGKVEVSRQQLPLILAWAMSIHKSQGQTLEKVKIDLGRVFEKGQAYVAISRATSLEGLQIIGFQPSKVYAHPAVIEWSKTLGS